MPIGLSRSEGVRIAWGKKAGKQSGGAPKPVNKADQQGGAGVNPNQTDAGAHAPGNTDEKKESTLPDTDKPERRLLPTPEPTAPKPLPLPKPVDASCHPSPTSTPPPPPPQLRRRSLLACLFPCMYAQPIHDTWDYNPPPSQKTPLRAPSPASECSWTHHDSYYPSFEPDTPKQTTYFPKFDDFKSRHHAKADAAAAFHAQLVGHPVCVHYPDLPAFEEYKKAGVGWKETQWGTQNWMGFGWDGERLPNAQGQYFSAPMPKGVPIARPNQQGGTGNKKKGKEGEGGGGGGGGGGGNGKKGKN
ncbi:hypothetical protein CC85DRAFT_52271 [Cutaneotrichosporon oleaginosum]|uniref:Uncharacterized protein n=1 Tax=Cutaneotrichosporon oleaginosum TaxID=879819 RepID=A0A0J0XQP9_9TREE|nr:uncharacterized protein CC85DRAFT_52271 [Cutaneotrichosporon oleaginosum]KLT43408.1 hypothetical protein CC85DRAFT_52271 [Cutaneotrichosporon oleaginosum]TXT05378.1 hypothetical protein COLE_06698 [Cutaneotrichosporon oleaginosum]